MAETDAVSVPLATSRPTKKEQTYMFANQCDLEIYCSPFGVSALYINIKNLGIVGIGSTMGRITGETKGKVYYNNGDDFKKKKFKIHGIVEEDDLLRIDFFRIFKNEGKADGVSDEVKTEESDHSSLSSDFKVAGGGEDDEEVEIPDIIFKGPCPDCRPEKVEPFIGVFSFETED